MLTEFHLGRFKGFAETQRIPIKPLTLIFGPNSSGKSSIIHGLLYGRHALDTGELDVYKTSIGGDSVDLGGYRQFKNKWPSPFNDLQWAVTFDRVEMTGWLADLLSPVGTFSVNLGIGATSQNSDAPDSLAETIIRTFEIAGDDTIVMRMSFRKGGDLQMDFLNNEHPILKRAITAVLQSATTSETFTDNDYETVNEAIAELVPSVTASIDRFIPDSILIDGKPIDDPERKMLFPVSRGNRDEDIAAAIRFYLPRIINQIISGANESITKELTRLHYLGPLRSFPPRHIAFTYEYDSNWHAGGGYTWDIVRKNSRIRERINAWLGDKQRLSTPYELAIESLISFDDLENDYENQLYLLEDKYSKDSTPEEIEQGLFYELHKGVSSMRERSESTLARVQELIMIDKRSNVKVTHRDVGIGISQVLPVLVMAYASKGKILTIEQPEIHLHPALQAELGDVFIESALGENKNTCILETHSEHLILRLMRRMRDTMDGKLPSHVPPISPEDVAVLYVQPLDNTSVVRVLELDEEGQLLDPWPGGFFEEGFRERFA
ncbi:MAG: DUF3696 domain-containing protein [Candidatus Xenobiia bacterium LiM19]